MKGKPAKVLGVTDMRQAIRVAAQQRYAYRNKAIVLLSFKAGLRAGEIAALKWGMILDATGRVGRFIELPACVAKKGSGRRIPLGPELPAALKAATAPATHMGRPGYQVLPRPAHDRQGRGELVHGLVPQGRLRRLFVPFGTPDLRNTGCKASNEGWGLSEGRPTACRSPFHPNDPGVH